MTRCVTRIRIVERTLDIGRLSLDLGSCVGDRDLCASSQSERESMASPGRGPACLTLGLFLSWYPYQGAHALWRARSSSPDPKGTPADIKSSSLMALQTAAQDFSLHQSDFSSAHFCAANPANGSNLQPDPTPSAADPHGGRNRPSTLSSRDPPSSPGTLCDHPGIGTFHDRHRRHLP